MRAVRGMRMSRLDRRCAMRFVPTRAYAAEGSALEGLLVGEAVDRDDDGTQRHHEEMADGGGGGDPPIFEVLQLEAYELLGVLESVGIAEMELDGEAIARGLRFHD